jgi:hypothetical protein
MIHRLGTGHCRKPLSPVADDYPLTPSGMCANQLLHRQRIEKFIGDNKERAVLWKVIERGGKFDTGYLFGL